MARFSLIYQCFQGFAQRHIDTQGLCLPLGINVSLVNNIDVECLGFKIKALLRLGSETKFELYLTY